MAINLIFEFIIHVGKIKFISLRKNKRIFQFVNFIIDNIQCDSNNDNNIYYVNHNLRVMRTSGVYIVHQMQFIFNRKVNK